MLKITIDIYDLNMWYLNIWMNYDFLFIKKSIRNDSRYDLLTTYRKLQLICDLKLWYFGHLNKFLVF